MRRFGFCILFALAACASEPPAPQPVGAMGSPAAGLAYAQQNCASCHAIGRDENFSSFAGAPPFEEIANTPGMTGMALRVWLQSPHQNMPHIMVEPARVDDVWAYIASLEQR